MDGLRSEQGDRETCPLKLTLTICIDSSAHFLNHPLDRIKTDAFMLPARFSREQRNEEPFVDLRNKTYACIRYSNPNPSLVFFNTERDVVLDISGRRVLKLSKVDRLKRILYEAVQAVTQSLPVCPYQQVLKGNL